LALELH